MSACISAEMKRVTSTLAKGFICERCVEPIKGIVAPAEELPFYDQEKLQKNFCYLGDRLNASGGSEAAVTARTSIGLIDFRECR